MAVTVPRAEVEPGVWLDGRRALWFEACRCLVVADLHWGYAASHRAAGNLLPAWGDTELAQSLDGLLQAYQPEEMIWLGDIVHAAPGRARAEAYLSRINVPVVVVRGNHDRAWRNPEPVTCVERAGFVLHHGDQAPAIRSARELVGHYHPAADCGHRAGARVKVPALVTGPRRWILPAFSPWAAGAVWNHLLAPDETLWAISRRRILPLLRLQRGSQP